MVRINSSKGKDFANQQKMKRKREEGDGLGAEDGSPPSLLLPMPDLVHNELMGYSAVFLTPPPIFFFSVALPSVLRCSRWLDVTSALRLAGTCRKGRALVLQHHKAAQLVVGFLVRHLLSVAGSPFSAHFTSLAQGTTPVNPNECDRGLTGGSLGCCLSVTARYTSFYERWELFYAAQDLARRLPLPNLALDDSGIGPNGQPVGDDCSPENESGRKSSRCCWKMGVLTSSDRCCHTHDTAYWTCSTPCGCASLHD